MASSTPNDKSHVKLQVPHQMMCQMPSFKTNANHHLFISNAKLCIFLSNYQMLRFTCLYQSPTFKCKSPRQAKCKVLYLLIKMPSVRSSYEFPNFISKANLHVNHSRDFYISNAKSNPGKLMEFALYLGSETASQLPVIARLDKVISTMASILASGQLPRLW